MARERSLFRDLLAFAYISILISAPSIYKMQKEQEKYCGAMYQEPPKIERVEISEEEREIKQTLENMILP